MQLTTVLAQPQTDPTPHRPLRIADTMVLIAASFVAMAWDRAGVLSALRSLGSAPLSFSQLITQLFSMTLLLFPFLVLGSPTVAFLRLQSPRPPWRRLLQQPGMTACSVASLALIPVTLMVLAVHFSSGRPLAVAWARAGEDLQPERLAVVAIVIGMAVAVAWIVAKGKGQWKPEPSWIDRLGRMIGVGWIAMIFGGSLSILVSLIRVLQQVG